MYILLSGILIFFGIHLVPNFVAFKRKLIARLGEDRYKGVYSVVALAGLVLIIYGKSIAVYQPIWEPPVWGKNLVIVTMVLSFILFAAADMKSNIKRFIRHPMLMGVVLWSGAHLCANGDFASILLFGSFCMFSVFKLFSADMRGVAKQEIKYPFSKDVVTVIAGLVVYVIFIKYLHPYLIGVSIV